VVRRQEERRVKVAGTHVIADGKFRPSGAEQANQYFLSFNLSFFFIFCSGVLIQVVIKLLSDIYDNK
jgi:hypothetical protein